MKSKIFRTIDFRLKWFCRKCWLTGIEGVTVRANEDGKFLLPTKEELMKMAKVCHAVKVVNNDNKCSQPSIRLHYDSEKMAS